jgi:hypothetical protein
MKQDKSQDGPGDYLSFYGSDVAAFNGIGDDNLADTTWSLMHRCTAKCTGRV